MQSLPHRPDLDGLRAIAVIPVVLFHADVPGFAGGFVGVDVFFVLSGYLITGILLRDMKAQEFSYIDFLTRRMRRLFPALFAMLIVSSVTALLILLPADAEDFGESLATTVFYTSNFLFFTESGYFEGAADLKPLLHTWSLAVEEQFYLLFPAVLLAAAKQPNRTFPVLAITLGLSALISGMQSVHYPEAAFYLLPARAWELLVGALVASAMFNGYFVSDRLSPALGWCGLLCIALAVVLLEEGLRFPWPAALLPCLGTAALIVAGTTPTLSTTRLLSLRPLVFVGLISYSLYLWHWPALTFAKIYTGGNITGAMVAVLLVCSLVMAVLSWRYIEQPFRGQTGLMSRRRFVGCCLSVSLLAVALGVFLDRSEGWPTRLPTEIATKLGENIAVSERRECVSLRPEAIQQGRVCRIGGEQKPSFAVWGDSHAAGFMPLLSDIASAHGRSGLSLTAYGCPPLHQTRRTIYDPKRPCEGINRATFDLLAANPLVTDVILAARWPAHAEGRPYRFESGANMYLAFADKTAHDRESNRQVFSAALQHTVAELAQAGKRVWIVNGVPEIGMRVPETYYGSMWRGTAMPPTVLKSDMLFRQAAARKAIQLAAITSGATVFDPALELCGSHSCPSVVDGKPYYSDGNHLSGYGVELLRPLFTDLFTRLAGIELARRP